MYSLKSNPFQSFKKKGLDVFGISLVLLVVKLLLTTNNTSEATKLLMEFIFFVLLSSIILSGFLNHYQKKPKYIALKLLTIIFLSTTFLFILNNYKIFYNLIQNGDYLLFDVYQEWLNQYYKNILIITLLWAGIIYTYIFSHSKMTNQVAINKLQSQLNLKEINSLYNNLQPHFLFNSLNTIASLITEDNTRAQDAVVDLSTFLRQTLRISNRVKIPLLTELSLLESYLNLMYIRHNKNLKVINTISLESYGYLVPALILQPIFENSIKHGFSNNHKTIKVELTIYLIRNKLSIQIRNTGQLPDFLAEKKAKGFGNLLLDERLKALYSNNFKLENIINYRKKFYEVKIEIPAEVIE